MTPRNDQATIVVCEDDPATLELLCDNLVADRFDALPAASASDALRLCRFNHPDAMVLDLGLPDASGLDVLREVRQSDGVDSRFDPAMPILILSGLGAPHERIRGIKEGADDYLVKPFHYPELAARIETLLRRRSPERHGPVRVGSLMIDPRSRSVAVDGERVELTNKEYSLLVHMAVEPARVFTKSELLYEVWGFGAEARTRTLDSHASRLRRKLDPENGRFVVNCWGIGYRLVVE